MRYTLNLFQNEPASMFAFFTGVKWNGCGLLFIMGRWKSHAWLHVL